MKMRLSIYGLVIFGLIGCANQAGAQAVTAAAQDELRNWFNDPYVQLRSAIADCPVPLGPLMTEAQSRQESHYRVERGTSCFLAGECKKPNAYFYDADIGAAVVNLFATEPGLAANTSLWLTVKRRFVWIQGCRASDQSVATLEARIKALPDVQLVFVNVASPTSKKSPYDILPRPH